MKVEGDSLATVAVHLASVLLASAASAAVPYLIWDMAMRWIEPLLRLSW